MTLIFSTNCPVVFNIEYFLTSTSLVVETSQNAWIVGGTVGINIGGEVQIWRRNNGSENDYTKVGFSILEATDPDNDHVYEYIPDPPLEFQEGDILGVYQQRGNMIVFYQDTTGPANYRRRGIVDVVPPAPATLNEPTLVVSEYDYPLVTVEIGEYNLYTVLYF